MNGERREWLIELRKSRGYSQEQAALRIGVDTSTLGRWERGAQQIRHRNRAAMAEAFGLSVRQLLVLIDDESARLVDAQGPVGSVRDDTVGRLYGTNPVESLAVVIDGYRGLDHSVGPGGVLDLVRSHLVVAGQLQDASRSHSERVRLLNLTAQIHQLAGWMSFDTLDLAAARQSFDEARAAADAAEDPQFLAFILGPSAAFAEADMGEPGKAIDLAYAALGHARRSGNLRLVAFVHAITARVHAKLGDDRLAHHALEDAAKALAAHDGWQTDPIWLHVFDETALAGHAGSVELDLGKPERAVELLDRQDANSDEIFVRNRAIWRLDRAAALRDLGDVDRARSELTQAGQLVDSTTSPRTRWKLNKLTRSL